MEKILENVPHRAPESGPPVHRQTLMLSRETNNSDHSFLFLLQIVSLKSLSSGRQSKKVYQCCENVRKEIYDLHKEYRYYYPVAGLFHVFHVSAIRTCESRPKRLIAALPPKPNLSFAGLRLSMPLFTSRNHGSVPKTRSKDVTTSGLWVSASSCAYTSGPQISASRPHDPIRRA